MNFICVICYGPASITYSEQSGGHGLVAAFCKSHEKIGKDLTSRNLSAYIRTEHDNANEMPNLRTTEAGNDPEGNAIQAQTERPGSSKADGDLCHAPERLGAGESRME